MIKQTLAALLATSVAVGTVSGAVHDIPYNLYVSKEWYEDVCRRTGSTGFG